jgi:hypothetical protein
MHAEGIPVSAAVDAYSRAQHNAWQPPEGAAPATEQNQPLAPSAWEDSTVLSAGTPACPPPVRTDPSGHVAVAP